MDQINDFLKNRIHSGFRPIVIHSLEEAQMAMQAAGELNVPVALVSAPGAPEFGGVGWFQALIEEATKHFPNVSMTAILDCRDRAGDAMEALRTGIKHIRYNGDAETVGKLRSMGAPLQARIHTEFSATLDLRNATAPLATCRKWLEAGKAANQDAQFPLEEAV